MDVILRPNYGALSTKKTLQYIQWIAQELCLSHSNSRHLTPLDANQQWIQHLRSLTEVGEGGPPVSLSAPSKTIVGWQWVTMAAKDPKKKLTGLRQEKAYQPMSEKWLNRLSRLH